MYKNIITGIALFSIGFTAHASSEKTIKEATLKTHKVVVFRDNSDRFKQAYFRVRLNNDEVTKIKRGQVLAFETQQINNVLDVNDSNKTRLAFQIEDNQTRYIRAKMLKSNGYSMRLSLSDEAEFQAFYKNRESDE